MHVVIFVCLFIVTSFPSKSELYVVQALSNSSQNLGRGTSNKNLHRVDFDSNVNLNRGDGLQSFRNNTQVKKCCPIGQNLIFHQDGKPWSCNFYQNLTNGTIPPWQFNFYAFPDDERPIGVFYGSEAAVKYVGAPKCNYSYFTNKEEVWFRLLKNGEPQIGLNFWMWPLWLPPSKEHCIDIHISKPSRDVRINTQLLQTEVLLYCDLPMCSTYILHRKIYAASFAISAMSLLLLIILYIVIWDRTAIHGWAQISYFLALFLFYCFEGARIVTKIVNGLTVRLGSVCFYQAAAAQYFTFTISTTLNVLGFDMFWTFWKMEPPDNWKSSRVFIIYAVLSWIVPLAVLIIALTANHFYNPNASKEEIGQYKFGHYRCTSPGWHMAFQIQCGVYIINIGFFIATLIILIKAVRVSQVSRGGSQNDFFSQSLGLFIKLSIAMGMTHIGTVLEFLYGQEDALAWYWVLGRISLLGLKGLWLFLILGCRRRHWETLRRKYPSLKRSNKNVHAAQSTL